MFNTKKQSLIEENIAYVLANVFMSIVNEKLPHIGKKLHNKKLSETIPILNKKLGTSMTSEDHPIEGIYKLCVGIEKKLKEGGQDD